MVENIKTDVRIITGNQAAAEAVKLCRPKVIAAYPITPQTPVTEALSQFVESGQLDAQYVTVEGEHSAISVLITASMVGARTFTATSANGLGYMCEQLHWAAGSRLPIVLTCVNRAMAAPWNVLNDQQDSISQRDAGWLQIYTRNNQEICDTIIQAYKIAEKIYVPIMVCYDGYVLSHTAMPVEIPSQREVDRFLPPYQPHTFIDGENPRNYNLVTLANPRENARGVLCHGYMEFRYLLEETLEKAPATIYEVCREFKESFGRDHGTMIWTDRMDDAEIAVVAMGSLSSEASVAIDELRKQGHKAGLMGIRVYRPFPKEEVAEALKNARVIVVFDKNISYGYQGATCADVKAALFDAGIKAIVQNYIAGLGGRDVKARELAEAVRKTLQDVKNNQIKQRPQWLNCFI